MAFNLLDLYAKISLDTGDYEKGVDGAAKKSTGLQNAFKQTAHISETLQNKINVLASQHEKAQKEVERLTDAFNKSAKEKGVDSKETQELAEKLKDAENNVSSIKKEMDGLTESTQKTGKEFESSGGKISAFADKLKSGLKTAAKVGAAAIGAAATAVTAFAKASIDAGSQFDAAMSQVAAISGATGADFDSLRDKAMEMGSKTKFSATESAEAFNYMAMAGWKTEDMLNGIEGIMNLAAASGENLATTSDIVTDALTAFGLSASDSAHFADILAVASSNANTNVGMMGETFKYVAPVAGSMGYSAEDAALAIGLMANSGIKASQAGTALRSIITRLSTDAGASSKSLGALGVLTEELGVQFYNADGSARDFGDVLMETREAWKDLTQEEQINYANKIAGQEAISGWNAIMNASEADVSKLADAISNADGAALQMANTMQDNLSGDITIFKSALEGLQIQLSDKLTPILRDIVQDATNFVSSFNVDAAVQSLENLMGTMYDLTPVIAGVTAAIVAYKTAMEITALVNAAIESVKAYQAANEGATVAQALLNTTILANPFALIISIIAAVVVAIGTLWATNEDFRDAVKKIWEDIKQFFSDAWEAIKNTFAGIGEWFSERWADIKEVFSSVGSWFSEKFTAAKNGIVNVWSDIKSRFSKIWSDIKSAFNFKDALNWGKDLINNFINGITEKWNALKNKVSSVAQTVKNFLGFSEPKEGPLSNFHTYAPDMMKLFAQGIEENADIVRKQFDKSLDFGTASVDYSSSGMGRMSGGIGSAVQGAVNEAGGALADIVINLTANLDGKPIYEGSYRYARNRERAYGVA